MTDKRRWCGEFNQLYFRISYCLESHGSPCIISLVDLKSRPVEQINVQSIDLFPTSEGTYLLSELASNRNKIGVDSYMQRYTSNRLFYNELVSKVLFGKPNHSSEAKIKACQELLDRVAFVDIEFTSEDVVKVSKRLRWKNIDVITLGGGLLSLYAGFSGLSLAEIVFWAVIAQFRRGGNGGEREA